MKLSTRALRALRTKSPRFASAVKQVTPKDPKKALIGLGAVNVGGQLLNAGLDAQSTAYFARERKNLAAKKTNNVEKFDNGMGSGVELRKSARLAGTSACLSSNWRRWPALRRLAVAPCSARTGYTARRGLHSRPKFLRAASG